MAAFGQRSVLFLWTILFTFHSKAQSSLGSCDAGWTKYPSSKSCIKIFGAEVSGRKTWSNARLTCQQSEGDLVTIRDAGMTALIKKIRRSTTIKLKPRESGYWTGFWIGLHDRHFENNWIWLDENETATYTNWYYGQPDDWPYYKNGEDCAMAYLRDASWNDLHCTAKLPYICERPILSSAVGQCPAKWSKNPGTGTCIQMGGQPIRWQAARAECIKRDGNLVTIVDDYMNTFVNEIRKENVDEISWIGLNKMGRGGNFSWSKGNKQVKYTNWAAKYSGKNSKVKNCVVTGVNDVGEWAALKCTERRDFICERQPVCPLVGIVVSTQKSAETCRRHLGSDDEICSQIV
ncbi:macrophage mannose receptor 1 [Plakobranchus ocellatus]|uniref:Macrophage mannose receptor 1 n=1 Tax=Plakobranchus ocellatus TaxID=259542 RepID=A0AAV3ZQ27_9GAST|nr:macrophage mannose receptor 1 [Plakobranchus ocellatus]